MKKYAKNFSIIVNMLLFFVKSENGGMRHCRYRLPYVTMKQHVRIQQKSFWQMWCCRLFSIMMRQHLGALVIKGTVDIQGLVALYPSSNMQAVFITWMCTAPFNNKQLGNEPRYIGAGGHLFAIAAQKSIDYGYGGALTGFAANMDLVQHYCRAL